MKLEIKTYDKEKWINYGNLIKTLNSMKNIKIEKMKKSKFHKEKDNIYIKLVNEITRRIKKAAKEPIEKGETVADTVRSNETYCENCDKFTLTIKIKNHPIYTCQNCGHRKSPKKIFRKSQKTEFEIGGLKK